MAVQYCSASTNQRLWRELEDRFLGGLGASRGPGAHPAFVWLTHRIQRDALYIEAAARGLPGWLAPPIAFFSDLPGLFGITQRRIGLLRRRALIGRLARERGNECGLGGELAERTGLVQGLDGLFGELLPEGVSAETLEAALEGIGDDDFARCRNAWVTSVFGAYLDALDEEGIYDPRQIHAMVAERIAAGELPEALNGATELQIYGLTSLRARRKLIEALDEQSDGAVTIYVAEDVGGVSEFGDEVEALEDAGSSDIVVKPAPDGRREFEWVACKVKELLVAGDCDPHEIAIVARMGRDDTRRAHEIFTAAGIPNTARIRSPLAQVPALKALLALFRGAARGWTYRPLRAVLAGSYFDIDVDLRSIDYIAKERRVEGLDRWAVQLCRLKDQLTSAEDDWRYASEGLFTDRLAKDCEAFDEFVKQVRTLSETRSLSEWVKLTKRLLKPGLFNFRSQICDGHGERWENVRLDQRGVERLDRMLVEWPEFDGSEAIAPDEWYGRLRQFLESNEIALTTPLQTGVQVLEAHEAALFPFRHTFVVHANDGEFPRRPPAGVIFSDEERMTMAERGLPLSHRELWLRRERALWRSVTANANVTVTYRTADPNGVPLLPSLMVPEHDAAEAIPRTQYTWDTPFNRSQARRAAAARFAELKRSGDAGAIEVPEPAALKHAVLNAYAESQRREGPRGADREAGMLNPWNGEIRDPWVLEHLSKKFGDDGRWSASKLETYAECPFLFLVQKVLYLQDLDEAEEGASLLTFGSVAHELLERFYPAMLKGPFPGEFDETAESLFADVAAKTFAELEGDDTRWLGIPPLWAVTKRELLHHLTEFLRWELPKFGNWRPGEFELDFGFGDDAVEIEGEDLSGEWRKLRVVGRIDRVDVKGTGDDAAFRILDYKTSNVPAKTHYQHGVVQIPIYMKAVAGRLSGRPEYGGYLSLKKQKEGGQAYWEDENFQRAMQLAMSIPARVREGKFEPAAAQSVSQWPSYWPGLDVVRVKKILKDRCRFDE